MPCLEKMAEKMRLDDERIFGITKLKLQAFSLDSVNVSLFVFFISDLTIRYYCETSRLVYVRPALESVVFFGFPEIIQIPRAHSADRPFANYI